MKLIDADALFRKLYNTDPNTKGKFSDGIVKAMCFIINTPPSKPNPYVMDSGSAEKVIIHSAQNAR